MKNIMLLTLLALSLPSPVFAVIVVTQVKDSRALVSFQDGDAVKLGGALQLKGQPNSDSPPLAAVTKVSGHQAILKLSQGMTLKLGDFLEVYPVAPEAAPVAEGDAAPAPQQSSQYDDRAWHFGGGLSYDIQPILIFNSISTQIGNYSENLTYNGAFGLALEAKKSARSSWGMMFGLSYDFASSLSSGTFSGAGGSQTFSGGNSSLQTTLVYGNAIYRWDSFYLPFGLNYSLVSYTPIFQGSPTVSGGVGGQVGVGYTFMDHFAVELYDRVVSFTLSTNLSGVTTNYGTGYAQSFLLIGKYFF